MIFCLLFFILLLQVNIKDIQRAQAQAKEALRIQAEQRLIAQQQKILQQQPFVQDSQVN